jgi:hypothetical protein
LSDQAPPGLYHPAPGSPSQGGYPQDPGGPDSTPPRERRRQVRNIILGALGVLGVIVIVIVLAASGGGGGSPAPSASGTPRAPGSLPSGHARPATGIGTSFAARTGSGGTYRVRLDLILDPAQPAGPPATRQHGVRLIGVVLTVKAVHGALRGVNAYRDAAVVGSNGRTYLPAARPIAGYAGFRHGRISVAQGGSATGAVTFRLPAGVSVSRVTWVAGDGSALRWPVP